MCMIDRSTWNKKVAQVTVIAQTVVSLLRKQWLLLCSWGKALQWQAAQVKLGLFECFSELQQGTENVQLQLKIRVCICIICTDVSLSLSLSLSLSHTDVDMLDSHFIE